MIFPYLSGEPIVPLQIKGNDTKWYEFYAYIDSGAGYSVFHADHAELLDVKIYKGTKIFLTVGDGAKIESFVHKLPVLFAGREFIADISFSPSLGIGTNILGMRSFFDNFQICFNNKRGLVEVNFLS